MNSKTRKILFLSCFIIFIIACPILLAYSIGLNFDFNNKKIIPTGSISIKSIPKKSAIHLNGNIANVETPAYISNLPEGEYSIKITKNGFSEWQKQLNVKNYQITYADNALLLPLNSNAQSIFNEQIGWISFSPSRKKAIASALSESSSDLYLLNLSINESPIVSRVDSSHKLVCIDSASIRWSADENSISFFGQLNNIQKGYIILPLGSAPKVLEKTENLSEFESMWHKENPEIFSFVKDSKIYQRNIKTGASAELASSAANFTNFGNKTFFIEKNSGLIYSITDPWTSLSSDFKITNQFSKMPIPDFSPDKKYSLSILSSEKILVQDQDYNLFIVSGQETKMITEKISGFCISPLEGKILFYSGHEIGVLENLKENSSDLIARSEQQIKKALWFSDSYIAYLLFDGSFFITELDGRNGRNALSPISEKISDFWIEYKTGKNYPVIYYLKLKDNRLFKTDWDRSAD